MHSKYTGSNSNSPFNEQRLIEENLKKCLTYTKGSVSEAAQLMGVDRRTIQRRVKMKLNLTLREFKKVQNESEGN